MTRLTLLVFHPVDAEESCERFYGRVMRRLREILPNHHDLSSIIYRIADTYYQLEYSFEDQQSLHEIKERIQEETDLFQPNGFDFVRYVAPGDNEYIHPTEIPLDGEFIREHI